jgi:hypothetical protein
VKTGEMKIGPPRIVKKNGKADAWACSWSLSETDGIPKDIYGEDALSALTNCLEFLSGYIHDQGEAGVDIWWLAQGDNAGLNFHLAK